MTRAFAAPRRPAGGRPGASRAVPLMGRGQAIGLYGGSFNPVHEGHMHVAQTALRRLDLDRVIWLVSPQNPLKRTDETADLAQRLNAVKRRLRGRRMAASDCEQAAGLRYTIDTVRWLKARRPGVRFVWIMGADSLAGFHRWRGWADLAREVPIVIVSRPGAALRSRFSPMARRFAAARRPAAFAPALAQAGAPAWTYLAAPFHAVSSTALRRLNRG